MTVKANERNYEILNIVGASTVFSEQVVLKPRCAEVMMARFEGKWIRRHGTPSNFNANPKFCQPFFKKYLKGQGIKVNERPARCSHENARVERSNGSFKSIFEKLSKEKTRADIHVLVARRSFGANLMFG